MGRAWINYDVKVGRILGGINGDFAIEEDDCGRKSFLLYYACGPTEDPYVKEKIIALNNRIRPLGTGNIRFKIIDYISEDGELFSDSISRNYGFDGKSEDGFYLSSDGRKFKEIYDKTIYISEKTFRNDGRVPHVVLERFEPVLLEVYSRGLNTVFENIDLSEMPEPTPEMLKNHWSGYCEF